MRQASLRIYVKESNLYVRDLTFRIQNDEHWQLSTGLSWVADFSKKVVGHYDWITHVHEVSKFSSAPHGILLRFWTLGRFMADDSDELYVFSFPAQEIEKPNLAVGLLQRALLVIPKV